MCHLFINYFKNGHWVQAYPAINIAVDFVFVNKIIQGLFSVNANLYSEHIC